MDPRTQTLLLTFPAYGTRLEGSARGWLDAGCGHSGACLPEPARAEPRPRGLRWPPVALGAIERRMLLGELLRIGRLRRFTMLRAVAAADHVHVLLETGATRDLPRLVHDIKGATSRGLSMGAGDPPPRSPDGAPLPHHKWWARQYSLLVVPAHGVDRAQRLLRAHPGEDVTVWPNRRPSPEPSTM